MVQFVSFGIVATGANAPAFHVDFLSCSVIDFEPGVGEILSIE